MTTQASSTAELAAAVRDAFGQGTPLRIRGRGTWLDAGGAVPPGAAALDVSGIAGIVEYVAGDLTLTAGAGTTLADLDAATAAHGQWCPLLPWGGDDVTLGAVMATATTGPFALTLGRPRDLAIGLEFVDGTGTIIRGGGRVVKNVAGFDLTRLLVGSWGALGAITEVSVRLRARPKVDETWALALEPGDAPAGERLRAFERGPYAPLASWPLDRAACANLGLVARGTTLIRLGGNTSFVAASRAAVRTLGEAERLDASAWTAVRALGAPGSEVAAPGGFPDRVSRRVKAEFDPRHILNPGILGEATS